MASYTLSGSRFTACYLLEGDRQEAAQKASDICYEQTVEFPKDLVPAGPIRDAIVGRIERLDEVSATAFRAEISFAVETTAYELTQLLNVAFGNISLRPGIVLSELRLPPDLLGAFPGPRFGRRGLRERAGEWSRPLACAALKPMGLTPAELADQAYRLALGGIDLVKDDHGLTDQPFCRFEERLERCASAIERANRETGRSSLYVPNVTASAEKMINRARSAMSRGAGALLVAPSLGGIDSVRALACHGEIALPVLAHPAFSGSFVASAGSGIAHSVIFGQIMRLAGADATIFPNYGGRFAFSREECVSIAERCAEEAGTLKPIFPMPGGGMSRERATEMRRTYGKEFIALIGGGLHEPGKELTESARSFVGLLGSS